MYDNRRSHVQQSTLFYYIASLGLAKAVVKTESKSCYNLHFLKPASLGLLSRRRSNSRRGTSGHRVQHPSHVLPHEAGTKREEARMPQSTHFSKLPH
jgi:hypothetical protein